MQLDVAQYWSHLDWWVLHTLLTGHQETRWEFCHCNVSINVYLYQYYGPRICYCIFTTVLVSRFRRERDSTLETETETETVTLETEIETETVTLETETRPRQLKNCLETVSRRDSVSRLNITAIGLLRVLRMKIGLSMIKIIAAS